MAVNPALIKAAITLATDKRTWVVIGSIVFGVIFMIVGIVAAFLNIFSFDDSGSSTASAAYVQFVDDMKYAYGKLDAEIDGGKAGDELIFRFVRNREERLHHLGQFLGDIVVVFRTMNHIFVTR